MATVPATEFKAKCLELMDRVAEGRGTYVITKHGRPVAQLVPADPPRKKSVFGCMTDQMEIVGDIEQPLWTEKQWKELERERAARWKAAEASAPGRVEASGRKSARRTGGRAPRKAGRSPAPRRRAR